jgi:hypothetical protein
MIYAIDMIVSGNLVNHVNPVDSDQVQPSLNSLDQPTMAHPAFS